HIRQRVEQLDEVDEHSVRDDADALVEDPRRDEVQDVLLALHDDGVTGVAAALEADDEVRLLGQDVDDLALALVAPLDADDAAGGGAVLLCQVALLFRLSVLAALP